MGQNFVTTYEQLLASAPAHLTEPKSLIAPGRAPGHGIFYGLGTLSALADHVAKSAPDGPVLLISDAVLADVGITGFAAAVLSDAGREVLVYTDVDPEPELQNVLGAEALGKAEGATCVIGLGGGSAMDVAKAVAVGLCGPVSSKSYVTDPASRANATRAPLVLIPTTAGTGSEVSIFGVICEGKKKRLMADPLLVPDVAILDPLLTVSMPKSVTAATGIDALTHAIEAMTHKGATPVNDALSLAAISLIGPALKPAMADAHDLSARYDMLVGSALAMMSFNLTGALWAHSVSYIIGMEKPTPHGIGCGLGLPCLLEFNEPVCAEKHARIARTLGLPGKPGFVGKSALASSVLALMAEVGLPTTLEAWGISENRLDAMADQTVAMYPRPGNPRPMSAADSRAYWRNMYAGV